MPRGRLPDTLDRIRALLDAAAAPRVFLPLEAPASTAAAIADGLGVPLAAVAFARMAEADGDRFVAIVPGEARIDLPRLAEVVGARRARLGDPSGGHHDAPAAPAVVSGLPTVIDRALLNLEFVYGTTGDPSWVVRLEPRTLQRVTGAIVGEITRHPPRPARPAFQATEL
jgi:prolyl-tRNA editing enzyme YbaK/EbsC (Cys-tRNA(Pro) deacylase)